MSLVPSADHEAPRSYTNLLRTQIVESFEDRSDASEDDDVDTALDGDSTRTPWRMPLRTPHRTQGKGLGTRGTLLSTLKKSAPRQSFDIDKYERVRMPRLPSLGVGLGFDATPEEEENETDNTVTRKHPFRGYGAQTDGHTNAEDDVPYEGNSMTLADILLHAGHQRSISAQLLDEDEVEGDMSDWE